MAILTTITKLEKSKEYNSWKREHPKAYLAHAFKMNDIDEWQIGYFNPDSNLITVFVVNNTITRNPDAEVFKEQKKLVEKLNVDDVKFEEDEAFKAGNDVLNKEYKGTQVFKSFMILQNLEKVGQVWNITFVTQKFTTVNIKIDAKTGKCLSHKTISLIQQEKNKK